jgi:hypothetical protein
MITKTVNKFFKSNKGKDLIGQNKRKLEKPPYLEFNSKVSINFIKPLLKLKICNIFTREYSNNIIYREKQLKNKETMKFIENSNNPYLNEMVNRTYEESVIQFLIDKSYEDFKKHQRERGCAKITADLRKTSAYKNARNT